MADEEQNKMIEIFKDLTQLDNIKSRLFLESARWDMNRAVERFIAVGGFATSSTPYGILKRNASSSSSAGPQLSSRRLEQLSKLSIIDSITLNSSGSENEDDNVSSKPKMEHGNSLKSAASEEVIDVVQKKDGLVPKEEGVVPKEEDVVPKEEDVVPKEEDVVPKEEGVVPKEEGVVSKEGVVPKEGGLVPTNVLEKRVDETAARAEVPLIPNAPTTVLKIRLVDGTKLIAKFNHTHTIGDVRRYINAARSSFALDSFELRASYPPKTLKDNNQTLLKAGLIKSVIFQRLV